MAKTYDAEEHIRIVATAAERCRGLTVGLGEANLGLDEPFLPQGWATGHAQAAVKGFMEVFCAIDLGQAFPLDPEQRADSRRHLAEADEAFASADESRRNEFSALYEQFDRAAGLYYRDYAHALGSTASNQMIATANGSIDPIVRQGSAMTRGKQSHGLVFPGLVEALAINCDAILRGLQSTN